MRQELGEQFIFSKAIQSDLMDSVKCVNYNFCINEPTSKAIDINEKEFFSFVETHTERSIKYGHTVIAKTVEGKVAACLVSEDASSPSVEKSNLHPKLDPVISILSDLDEMKFWNGLSSREYFHILMIGVYPCYKGNRLADKLLQLQEDQAKAEGYKYIFAEATGPVSQYIFKKRGYTKEFSIGYKDYVYKGQKVFSCIDECDSCDLVVKKL